MEASSLPPTPSVPPPALVPDELRSVFGLRPLVRTKSLPVRFKKNKDSCALCLDRNCTAMKKALNNVSKEVSREVEAARELSAKLSLFVVPLPHISNLQLSTHMLSTYVPVHSRAFYLRPIRPHPILTPQLWRRYCGPPPSA